MPGRGPQHRIMIKHSPLQHALSEYVSATDYPYPIPKVGKLSSAQLKDFNMFFTNVSDELGSDIYYVGIEDKAHTFTNGKGWQQYLLFIKQTK